MVQMLPSMVIYLSHMVGVWAGEVLCGAVGTAEDEPQEQTLYFHFGNPLHLAYVKPNFVILLSRVRLTHTHTECDGQLHRWPQESLRTELKKQISQ